MNDSDFADQVRRALDEGTEHLPYRVTARLERSRAAALERVAGTHDRLALVALAMPSVTGASAARSGSGDDSAALARWLALPLLALMLGLGLLAVSDWSDRRRAQEIAAIDMALLADDVPLAIYADKGFGVYLKNSKP